MMSKQTKTAGRVLCLALICALLFSGCAYRIDIGENGLEISRAMAADEAFRMNDEVVTLAEAKIFLVSEKSRLTRVYGDDLYSQTVKGKTMADYLDEELASFLSRMAEVCDMAKTMDITLNFTEEDQISRAALDYYNGMTTEDKRYTGATLKTAEKAFTHYYLMQKVLDRLEETLDLEISDDEARVVILQQIFVTDYETALTVQEKALEGGNFARLASIYSESPYVDRTVGRNDLSETYQNAVYYLSNGELSQIFSEDGGYYLVKCINNYDVPLTMANKREMAIQRISEEFAREHEEYMNGKSAQRNDTALATFSFADEVELGVRTFFDVYDNVF